MFPILCKPYEPRLRRKQIYRRVLAVLLQDMTPDPFSPVQRSGNRRSLVWWNELDSAIGSHLAETSPFLNEALYQEKEAGATAESRIV